MELALNGKPLGTVQGNNFARAIFSVWLGEDPIDRGFRDTLLEPRTRQWRTILLLVLLLGLLTAAGSIPFVCESTTFWYKTGIDTPTHSPSCPRPARMPRSDSSSGIGANRPPRYASSFPVRASAWTAPLACFPGAPFPCSVCVSHDCRWHRHNPHAPQYASCPRPHRTIACHHPHLEQSAASGLFLRRRHESLGRKLPGLVIHLLFTAPGEGSGRLTSEQLDAMVSSCSRPEPGFPLRSDGHGTYSAAQAHCPWL